MKKTNKLLFILSAIAVLLAATPFTAGAFEKAQAIPYIVAAELSDHFAHIVGFPDTLKPGMRFCYEYSDESMTQEPDPLFGTSPDSRVLFVFDVVAAGSDGIAVYESLLQAFMGTSTTDIGYQSSSGWQAAGPFWASPAILLESQQPKDDSSLNSAQKIIDHEGGKVSAQTFIFIGDDKGRIEASYDRQTGLLLKLTYMAPEESEDKEDTLQSFELTLNSSVELEPSPWSAGSTDLLKEGLELEYEGQMTFTMIKGYSTTEPYHESIRVASTDGIFTKLESRMKPEDEPYISYQYPGAPDTLPYYLPPESLAQFEEGTFLFFDDTFPSIVRAGKVSLDLKYGRIITIEFSHGTSAITARYSMETGWLVSYYRTLELLFTFEIDVRLKTLPEIKQL